MSEAQTLAERYADRQLGPKPAYPNIGSKADSDAYREADDERERLYTEAIEAHLFLGEQTHRHIQNDGREGLGTRTITMREWDALRAYREDHGFDNAFIDDSSRVLLMGVVVTVKHEGFQHGQDELHREAVALERKLVLETATEGDVKRLAQLLEVLPNSPADFAERRLQAFEAHR